MKELDAMRKNVTNKEIEQTKKILSEAR